MLGYEERYGALPKAIGVFTDHVVAHYLHVAPVAAKQEFSDEMSFGIECDTMVDIVMGREELFKYVIIFFPFFIQWQVDFRYGYIRKVLATFPSFICFISMISFSLDAMSISIFPAKYPLQKESWP